MSTSNVQMTSYKISIVGDSKVGKKSFLNKLSQRSSLSLWNTNGIYEIIQTNSISNPADFKEEKVLYIFVFLYDLSRLDSLNYVLEMFSKIRLELELGGNLSIIFAGNKCDLMQNERILQTKEIVKKIIKERELYYQHFFLSLKENINVTDLTSEINNQKRRCQQQIKSCYMMFNTKIIKAVEEKNQKTLKQMQKKVEDKKLLLAEKDKIIDNQIQNIQKSQQKIDQMAKLNKNIQKNMQIIIRKIKLFNHRSEIDAKRLSVRQKRRKLKIKRRLELKGWLSDMKKYFYQVGNRSVKSKIKVQSTTYSNMVVKDKKGSKIKKDLKK